MINLFEMIEVGIKAVGCAEVISPRQIDKFRSEVQGTPLKEADVSYLVQEVTGLTTLHYSFLCRVLVQHVIETGFINRDAAILCYSLEDLCERRRRGWFDTCAVSHASQKGFVDKLFLIKISRKHN